MTTSKRLERDLPDILGDLSAAPTPEYLDDVFVRTGRMRQRPAWTFPERWLPMADLTRSRAFAYAPPLRSIAVALVVIALLVVAALAYVGSQQRRVPAPFGPAANGLITYETGGDIYVGDPVTGGSRLLVGGADDDHDPGFSPDGTLIAFLRSPDGIDFDLYTVRPDGTDLQRVTTSPINQEPWVNWAPDSRHFGLIHSVDGHNRFDLIGLDGQSQRLSAGDMDLDSFWYRPPLAQEILFRSVKDGHPGLYAMAADGTNIRLLITTPNPDNPHDLTNAEYSADGTRIFFQKAVQVNPDNGCCQLWVMDANGSNAHRFVSDAGDSWEGVPSVSPDGQWIAFWRVLTTSQIAVVRADGSGPVILTGPTLSGIADWNWAPDSSKLLMVPRDAADGAPRVYLLDPAGGRETTTALQAARIPDWQRLAR
jgi:Tol biopolymer transport system component